MRTESIEIGYADDGFRAQLHQDTSTANLVVEDIYLENPPFSDSSADLESIGWRPRFKEWLLLSCVSLVAMLDAFDATMMVPIIPVLSAVFEQPLRSVLWVDTSYHLASAASQPIFAMLSEVFGQGPILIIALVVATAGTGVCSGSLSVPSLVAGRLVQGAGNGGAMAVSLLLVTDRIPYTHRVRFSDYIYRAWAFGAILGPVSGGGFGRYGNWNWTFYFSYVFCASSLLVTPFAVDLREYKSISRHAAREMDWIGAILTFIGVGLLLTGVSWVGGPATGWDGWHILVTSCLGGLAMVALVLYESIWVAQPMFNLGIFSSIPTIMLYVGSLLHGLLVLWHLQNLSMYIFLVKRLSSLLTGVSIIIITAPSLLTLLLMAKLGIGRYPFRPRWIIRAGWMLNLLASGCFILLNATTPTPGWVFIFFATGVSHALLISGYNTCSHTESPPRKREELDIRQPKRGGRGNSPAFAILMYSILRTWGMCIAVPVGGTIVLTQMAQQIDRRQLQKIEQAAHGTLPGLPLPTNISAPGVTNLQLLAFHEFVEIAFFSELINNITRNEQEYTFSNDVEREFAIRSLSTIVAQEQMHALIANNALNHFGFKTIEPCQYNFPVSTLHEAIMLATTFTSHSLATLQDITERFAASGDVALVRVIGSITGNKGAQQGWFRVYQDKHPSEVPTPTTSDVNFAFTWAQGFAVPGSCPNVGDIELRTFLPLDLVTSPEPRTNKIIISWNHGPEDKKDDLLWVAYINQLNVPVVVPVRVLACDGERSTAIVVVPYDEFLLNGLTVAAVVNRRGPFANAAAVAHSAVYGPALFILE
ncbi:major facilitator superfamily domain-containing protein [Aspergillus varians]